MKGVVSDGSLIGLIINPRAKQHQRDPNLAHRLQRQIGEGGVVRAPSSFDELADVAIDLRERGVELLGIAGGDGTNHVTITHLLRAYEGAQLPYFALLRNGTMNTVANSLDIPRMGPERLLARYLESFHRRALTPMRFVEPNVLRVGDHYGFIFGTGAIYGFIAEYNMKDPRSPVWAAEVLLRTIGSAATGGERVKRVAQRWKGRVAFPDGTLFPERDYFTVGASTCSQIGLGFKPFYRSGETPDRYHMLGIHTSVAGFIAGLPNVWRGRTLGGHKTYERLTESATLIPSEGTIPYTLDGDVYIHEGPLELACGPRLRIVTP